MLGPCSPCPCTRAPAPLAGSAWSLSMLRMLCLPIGTGMRCDCSCGDCRCWRWSWEWARASGNVSCTQNLNFRQLETRSGRLRLQAQATAYKCASDLFLGSVAESDRKGWGHKSHKSASDDPALPLCPSHRGKGLAIDDTTFQKCSSRIPRLWPNTQAFGLSANVN